MTYPTHNWARFPGSRDRKMSALITGAVLPPPCTFPSAANVHQYLLIRRGHAAKLNNHNAPPAPISSTNVAQVNPELTMEEREATLSRYRKCPTTTALPRESQWSAGSTTAPASLGGASHKVSVLRGYIRPLSSIHAIQPSDLIVTGGGVGWQAISASATPTHSTPQHHNPAPGLQIIPPTGADQYIRP